MREQEERADAPPGEHRIQLAMRPLSPEAPSTSQRTVLARWGLLITVLLVAWASGTTAFVVRDHHRDLTRKDWQFASEFAAQLEQGGDWRIDRAWAPCGHANPEAFIDLKATSEGKDAAAQLRRQVESAGWTMINTSGHGHPEDFAATTAEGRVTLTVQQTEATVDVELSIDERC